MADNSVIALTNRGWKHVQLYGVTKMQKSWVYEGIENRVDVYFGRLIGGDGTPVVIMNVYKQGCGTDQVVDDNCDVWNNIYTSMSIEDGNEYYKYLKKHGFVKLA